MGDEPGREPPSLLQLQAMPASIVHVNAGLQPLAGMLQLSQG